ncbi:TraB/GumN family protein [Pseudomaricurvus alcaniphilus]|uniref:TraB/GumN family protein n=1 Tax=Pseudomaricurvus alcaniphilus TaxID=1166482 RepID=UPI001408A1D2|nr:TraB/GumN family protein [Pseudomaricurvus alcaniphilus]NHN36027.1 TraB/GumN family protein [Pseudomaricurvus alcaniphilus]
MKLRYFNPLFMLLMAAACLVRPVLAAPALWQVSGEDGAAQAYLFGSVHFGNESMYPLSDQVMQAFAASEVLAVELDIAPGAATPSGRELMQLGSYPAGVNLEQQLSHQQWQRLAAIARGQGLTPSLLSGLKPWLVAFILTAGQIRAGGYSEHLGVDQFFLQQARQVPGEMGILPLETVAQQLAVFDRMSSQRQIEFLLQTLSDYSNGPAMLATIIEAWRQGDERELEQRTIGILGAGESDLGEMLYQTRNRNMLDKLVAQLQQGKKLFVVVGAGHIVGAQGLRALLQGQGYQLTRIQ